jgi:hypothetical protein
LRARSSASIPTFLSRSKYRIAPGSIDPERVFIGTPSSGRETADACVVLRSEIGDDADGTPSGASEDGVDQRKGAVMQRIAVIARLKPEAEKRATQLIESGPPFDPDTLGFDRHAVYLSGNQVVFVFEGGRLDHLLHAVVRDPSNVSAFGKWEPLIDGFPTVAHEAYSWQRENGAANWGE